jgi:hypothetical protein
MLELLFGHSQLLKHNLYNIERVLRNALVAGLTGYCIRDVRTIEQAL